MTKDNSNENYYLAHLKTVNPFPLEFVNPRDKFVTIKVIFNVTHNLDKIFIFTEYDKNC